MFRQEGAILREFTGTKEYQYTTPPETVYFPRSIWMTAPWDHTDRYRCLYRYTYCIQNVNCRESVLEVAHYHTVLISQLCFLMFFKFTCSRILIIQWYQWWRCVTQFGVLDFHSFVLVDSQRTTFLCRNIRELGICLEFYIIICIKFIFWLMWCVISTWDFSEAKTNTHSNVRGRNLVSFISSKRFRRCIRICIL